MRRGESEGSLSREAVIEAALDVLEVVGIDGLSMRALAERLGVKAASLYWHIRDKDQLLELVADAVLERAEAPLVSGTWREQAAAACDQLGEVVAGRPAAAAVVLGSPGAVLRSRFTRELSRILASAGVADAEPTAAALVIQVVATARLQSIAPRPRLPETEVLTLAIDSGSWRAAVRAGSAASPEVATSVGGGGAPSVEFDGQRRVVMRNRRGGKGGAVELNPVYTWAIKVHGATWNTVLDLRGLRIAGVELDSGAGNLACTLPAPLGAVPLRVNSGIIGVSFHRPRGTALHATVSPGSTRIRIDDHAVRVVSEDSLAGTPGALGRPDRYELVVCSGCVKISMDDTAPVVASPPPAAMAAAAATPVDSVALLLDGIAARLQRT